MARIELAHPPRTHEELWWTVRVMFGVTIPRTRVCPDHVAPFEAFADAYFRTCTIGEGEPYSITRVIWHASRGLAGKSKTLATLGLSVGYIDGAEVTVLGGSQAQSTNVHNYMVKGMESKNLPREMALDITATKISLTNASEMRPLPASQKTVRGPHPSVLLCDEVDEMDIDIYDAALGQPMPQDNNFGYKVPVLTVISSTWQNPDGTLTEIFRRQEEQEPINDQGDALTPIYRWCYKENHAELNPVTIIDVNTKAVVGRLPKEKADLLDNNTLAKQPEGWLEQETIDDKKNSVSAEMFRTEYDLGEPSIGNRAIDTAKLDLCFVDDRLPISEKHIKDWDEWCFETPQPGAVYVCCADWAKEQDKTVISVVRCDKPFLELAYAVRMNRFNYPTMVGRYNTLVTQYQVGIDGYWHDSTGLGNVVNDYLDDKARAFQMVGDKRTKLFSDFVNSIEKVKWRLPKALRIFYTKLKFCRTGDLYHTEGSGPEGSKWHPPDELVSLALCWHASLRVVRMGMPIAVGEKDVPGKIQRHFQHPGESEFTRVEGPQRPGRRIDLAIGGGR